MSDETKTEVKEEKSVGGKVNKPSHWGEFFTTNYKLPVALSVKLSKYFDENVGEEYEVNAEFDYKFQRKVIELVIEYSEKEGIRTNRSWHDVYSELIVVFSNKSIGDIKNNKEGDS